MKRFLAAGARLALFLLSMAKVTGAVESFGAASLCGGRRFEPGQTLPLVVGTSLRYPVEVAGYDRILVEVLTPASAPCQTPSPSPTRPRR